MGTASKLLTFARGEIGYSRWTDPEAGTKYGRWYAKKTGNSYYGQSGVPYCAMFVSYCLDQTSTTAVGFPSAYCPDIVNAAKKAGVNHSASKAKAGDIVLFDWEGDGVSDHVGIVESNGSSTLTTIEGNTTLNGQSGGVARRSRAYSTVVFCFTPNFSSSSSSSSGSGSSSGSSGSSGSSSGSSSKLPTFSKATYTITASALNVRKTASLKGTKLKKSQLTSDGQKHANSDGSLKKGTNVDVSSTKNETSTKTVWGKIPSGYICLYQSGSTYVKKKSSSSSSSSSGSSSSSSFSTGTYKITASALKVRTGAGTSYAVKKKSQLTADGQKHANSAGCLLKGTKVTVSQVKKNGSDTWGKIPSGWIAMKYKGSTYVKKV